MQKMYEEKRYAAIKSGISRHMEKDFYKKDKEHGHNEAREASVEFYARIVEDLTRQDLTMVYYDRASEMFRFVFASSYCEDLTVPVALDSLEACTENVITQTLQYLEGRYERWMRAANESWMKRMDAVDAAEKGAAE